MFEVSPRSVSPTEGDIVSFDCITGESAPPPRVYWEREGAVFTEGEQYVATYGSHPPDSLVVSVLRVLKLESVN